MLYTHARYKKNLLLERWGFLQQLTGQARSVFNKIVSEMGWQLI